jgi:hypothetical protein
VSVHESAEVDWQTAAIVSTILALCDDEACNPASYKLCAACEAVVNETFPDRCADTDCRACHPRAARAET